MTQQDQRAAFEAWYQHHHGDRDVYVLDESGEYADKQVQGAFNVWQARAALQSQEPKGNDLMLSAVLRMPFEMAMANHLSQMQFYQRAQQALSELEALQSQDREDAPFLQEDDQRALHRFLETTEDGQGYDIGKDRIKRLAELGVVSNQGFGRYSVTMFGHWCHEKHWHQNPTLPLKTIDEHNAQAAIDHARRIEGEA